MNRASVLRVVVCCLIVILSGIAIPNAGARAPFIQRTFDALAEAYPGMVFAYVTVNGPRYQTLPRLDRENFRIFEDGAEQAIEFFEFQDDPLSVGILWGVSADLLSPDSMLVDGVSDARLTPLAFLESLLLFPPPSDNNTRNRIDRLAGLQGRDARVEYFVMEALSVRVPYTTDVRAMPQSYSTSAGSLDAIYIGLDVLKEAAYGRQALLLIANALGADGGIELGGVGEDAAAGFPADATGTAQSDTLKALAIRQGVPVYYILMGSGPPAPPAIQHIADITGGDGFLATDGFMTESAAVEIAQALNNQYLVGYRPTNSERDGKWRSLRVQIMAPEDSPRLSGRIKSGYYAPRS